MTLIKGDHSQPSRVSAPTGADVDQPNHSFRYLSLDTGDAAPEASALQPADTPEAAIQALKSLADAMYEESDTSTEPSTIPTIYTYWGQFIDHDITAGTDRRADQGFNMLSSDILDDTFTPQKHSDIEANIVNLRLPQLDLDSVYGGELGPQTFGVPEEGIYEDDQIHLRVGSNSGGGQPPAGLPSAAATRDLPRRQPGEPGVTPERVGEARIGDGRNDENLIVAQFHTSYLHFHNQVVEMLDARPEIANDPLFAGHSKFSIARQIVRWTYQWLVVHDYLKTVSMPYIVDEILNAKTSFFTGNETFMPLEFSVAGYRFGHTMIRSAYDYNENFTMHSPRIGPAGLAQLFQFTFGGNLGGQPDAEERTSQLVGVWVIDWERFTNKQSQVPEQFARKIDTNLAMPLSDLPNAPGDALEINKNLARRNLLRGYLFNLPTGQHVAQALNVPVLEDVAPADKPEVKKILEDNGLDKQTPLWYYILREAEVQADGNSLGELGSRLVAGALIGLLKSDPESYINKGWDPTHETAVKMPNGQPIQQIMDFLRFAGVAPEQPVLAAA